MKSLIFVLLFASQVSFGDDWICKEESSWREGSAIFACGIGSGNDESHARAAAFQDAANEFMRVCVISSDCAGHETTVTPGRTTCAPSKGGITCQRAVTFEIGEEKQIVAVKKEKAIAAISAPPARAKGGSAEFDWAYHPGPLPTITPVDVDAIVRKHWKEVTGEDLD